MDQYVQPVKLKQGRNELFLKFAVATCFCPNLVRISDADGVALAGITYSVPSVPASNEKRSDFLKPRADDQPTPSRDTRVEGAENMDTPVKVKTEGTKVYLEGVEPMTWGKGEMCEFAAALTRTLSCVGEEVPYHYVMGVTGVAFRFTFGPEHWNPGFYGFEGVGPDVKDLIRRAFAAAGYGYILHTQGDPAEDRQRITDSVDRGISVMVRGHLVDASDWALVGGYDRSDSNLLFASSPYGRKDKPLPGLDAAPDWHAKTKYYIILGAKRERPAAKAVYTDALRLAVSLVRAQKIGDHYAGLKALEVLAATLRTDEFPAEAERQEDKPGFRYLCILCYNMMLDDHKSAAPFLRDAAKALPKCNAELAEAAACYDRACALRDQLEGILKSDFSQEAQKQVLDPEVREDFAAVLLKIRDVEEEGISHIERALASIEPVAPAQER